MKNFVEEYKSNNKNKFCDNLDKKHKIIVPELLVPAGDFDCVKAGVQNGADCIYFGANTFSARASAKNFNLAELKQAIEYCKIRNVKTNLTLNTLLTDSEFEDALSVAKTAYDYGIDAIIVQDLGFAKYLIDNFPGIEIHGSTQMSVHNLEGVLELQNLGFSRVVLSREVPINEIEYIRNNCNIDLEVFVHGALCISYSGQCLFSSLIGGRSGNRGKCAQPCRLPYELLESYNSDINYKSIDKGYILSPKDLCSLEFLPSLIKLGINSFKIEGRMKTPEYVATVTRIYRKYIDLAISGNSYIIENSDKKDLLQVFNRGGFSSGHLSSESNHNLIYPNKPNNIGLYVGNISNYNPNKAYITLKLNEPISIGDSISIDGESGQYTISELIKDNSNLKSACKGIIVKLGRIKGNINIGSKVYKISSKQLIEDCKHTFSSGIELKKIPLHCDFTMKKNTPIKIKLKANTPPFYNHTEIEFISDIIPEKSTNSPIDSERIKVQLSKLGNTPYCLEKIHLDLEDNIHISSISLLNSIRRTAICMLEEKVLHNFAQMRKSNLSISHALVSDNCTLNTLDNRKITVLLSNLDIKFDYSKLNNIDNIYIPLKFLTNKKYTNSISELSKVADIYVYMPTIIKPNYKNLLLNNLDEILNKFNIRGFVISNISGFIILKDYIKDFSNVNLQSNNNTTCFDHFSDNSFFSKKYKIIANYTMNILNNSSINELSNLGTDIITPSVELNKYNLQELCKSSNLPVELIAYGRTILMNSSYCFLGKSNKCYPECEMKCSSNFKYYIKDRLGLKFRILPDNVQTVTSIYNSKITSIDTSDILAYSLRIDILDENIDEINKIVDIVRTGNKLEGKEYTNGNLNKNI